MDENGFIPYFDPAKRLDVDPNYYAADAGPVVGAMPKKSKTAERIKAKYFADHAPERLKDAFQRGSRIPGSDGWHALKQMQDRYTALFGTKAGGEAFRQELVGPIAATTAGNNPTANFLMAHFAEFERKAGRALPKNSYDWPYPIGGRYTHSNALMYEHFLKNGTFDATKPKRREFMASMLGFRDRNVIDSRLSNALEQGRNTPRYYGVASELIDDVASQVGARDRRHFGDAVWAGLGEKIPGASHGSGRVGDGRIDGPARIGHNSRRSFGSDRSAIDVINEIIERTHRLTGMSRDEIFLRGFLLKEIPLYGIGGAAIAPIVTRGSDQGQGNDESLVR